MNNQLTFTIVTDTPPEQVEDQAILFLQPLLEEHNLDSETIESRCHAAQSLGHTWCQVIDITLHYRGDESVTAASIAVPMLKKLTNLYKLVYLGHLRFNKE